MNLLRSAYENAKIVNSGNTLTTVNEFTDQIPALRPSLLLEVALEVMKNTTFENIDKILTEEDKGAPLATAISLLSNKPLAVARWYPYNLCSVNEVKVSIDSEYFTGTLYMNGVEKDDRVLIVDDTISTGGAVIALANAVQQVKAHVSDIVCVIEKVQKNGRKRVKEKTGMDVKTIMKIDIIDDQVIVL